MREKMTKNRFAHSRNVFVEDKFASANPLGLVNFATERVGKRMKIGRFPSVSHMFGTKFYSPRMNEMKGF